MRMREISYEGAPPIESYAPGGFRLGGVFRPGSTLLIGQSVAAWPVASAPEISVETVAPALERADEVDLLLFGLGAEIAPLPGPARAALEAAGIGVEIMSTPSACRTYNVLLAEGRRVAAALIAL